MKNTPGVDTLKLANLKSNLDKLDIDKLENIPSNLRKLESKVGKLDINNLVYAPVYLNRKLFVLPSCRNQSINLLCKSIDCSLYEGNSGT